MSQHLGEPWVSQGFTKKDHARPKPLILRGEGLMPHLCFHSAEPHCCSRNPDLCSTKERFAHQEKHVPPLRGLRSYPNPAPRPAVLGYTVSPCRAWPIYGPLHFRFLFAYNTSCPGLWKR